MKGIILAAGKGTRLYPITKTISKPLLPIYDKPMIYYPLAILIESGIKDILIITAPNNLKDYQTLLGDGSSLGINIVYKVQKIPRGTADGLVIAEDFIKDENVCLIFGDIVCYGDELITAIKSCKNISGSIMFCKSVLNPERYGVIEFDDNYKVISLEEKPMHPKSNYASIGVFCFDKEASKIAKGIKPSERGELELTDVCIKYLNKNGLNAIPVNITWADVGTIDKIYEASNDIYNYQKDNDKYIGCLEEIAFRQGYITKEKLRELAEEYKNTDYGKYLISVYEKKKN
jgi:glucose-1-phosphate thymidylyltransferase